MPLGTANAEMKLSTHAENPGLRNAPSFKSGESQNVASLASPTARSFTFRILPFQVRSSSFSLILSLHDVTCCEQRNDHVLVIGWIEYEIHRSLGVEKYQSVNQSFNLY